ncbi:heat shock protein binding, partial [Trifolium pratense]
DKETKLKLKLDGNSDGSSNSYSNKGQTKPPKKTKRSSSDRTILGLPPTGPLKIEDVKIAYHLSALKRHPDKHQGPSQV